MIEFRDVGIAYGGAAVVERVSFRIGAGAFVGLVGANGSGKTSLLRVVARMLVPAAGAVWIDGRELVSYRRRDLARLVAGVWQRQPLSFGFTARQLVLLGRTPHLPLLRWETNADEEIVAGAMQETQTAHLADRTAISLSAGELQRVFIAAALAQQSRILLLDEPTSFLDLRQAARLSSLLQRLQEQGSTILCASHDLALLRRHASSIVLLRAGTAVQMHDPVAALSAPVLTSAFGIGGEEWYG